MPSKEHRSWNVVWILKGSDGSIQTVDQGTGGPRTFPAVGEDFISDGIEYRCHQILLNYDAHMIFIRGNA